MNDAMDDVVAGAQQQLERMRQLGEHMAAIRVTEKSADGAVTVTVDGNGALFDLQLTDAISAMAPTEFESLIVSTAQRAAAGAAARRGELVTSFNQQNQTGRRGT